MSRAVPVGLGLVLLFVAAVGAQPKEEIREPVYAGGALKLPSGATGKLDVRGEATLKVVWKSGEWELPYTRVQTLYASLSRPSAMVELGGVHYAFLLGAMKNRKLYLSMRYLEPDGSSSNCYFLVPVSASELVDVLAKKTNRNVVFESEEARRRLHGRR